MNSQTAILAALVLAVLLLVGAYGMMTTVVDEGNQGVDNFSNRTEGPIGSINFTSYETRKIETPKQGFKT